MTHKDCSLLVVLSRCSDCDAREDTICRLPEWEGCGGCHALWVIIGGWRRALRALLDGRCTSTSPCKLRESGPSLPNTTQWSPNGMCACAHTCTHKSTHMETDTHTNIHIWKKNTHTHTHTQTQTGTHRHKQVHKQKKTHTVGDRQTEGGKTQLKPCANISCVQDDAACRAVWGD